MVYVDDMDKPYKGMLMSHMIADSHSELLRMADKIMLDKKHLQHEGTRKEHFDVCKLFKKRAIQCGAVQITKRQLATKIVQRDYQEYDF